jgi:hypothetical protein
MIASIGGEKVRVCNAVAEETEKRLAAYRREKEKFGKHPAWRRVTGFTFPAEAELTETQRREGLQDLVKWIKGRAKDGRTANAERRTSNLDEGTANGTRLQHRHRVHRVSLSAIPPLRSSCSR